MKSKIIKLKAAFYADKINPKSAAISLVNIGYTSDTAISAVEGWAKNKRIVLSKAGRLLHQYEEGKIKQQQIITSLLKEGLEQEVVRSILISKGLIL